MRRWLSSMTLAVSLVISGVAMGQGGGGRGTGGPGPGPGPGPGSWMQMGGPGGCPIGLMRAHPDVLKSRLGLSDAQITQVLPVRSAFLVKKAKLQGEIRQLMAQVQPLMDADLPDQAKLIELTRKVRNVKGQLAEESLKVHLKLMQILTHDQRARMRAECPMHGRGLGLGMGGRRGGMGMRMGAPRMGMGPGFQGPGAGPGW